MDADTLAEVVGKVRSLRSRRKISLSQIAKKTCICTRYLEAIEALQWDLLPGGVYRVNYLRQYIAAIDPHLHTGFLSAALAPAPPAPKAEPVSLWRRLTGQLLNIGAVRGSSLRFTISVR